ncbi:MAG TPA: MATE family efflux transporter [Longimicrobiales bacterium]|nr:MATE family efflux transporter [Longimicrobiales bacterium]
MTEIRQAPPAAPPPRAPRPAGGRDATTGPILRALVRLAVPIVVTNVFQSLYQLIDTFWVGRLGAEAVAAVSLSFPILFLMISAGGGMSIAGAVLVAQTFGARDQEAVDRAAGQTLTVVAAISVVLSVAGYLLSPLLVGFFDPEPAVEGLAVDYLSVSFLGLAAVFLYFVFQALLRGVGEVRLPMIVVAGTVLLNFFLDPLLILGWGPIPAYGVVGAAWATILAQGVAGAVGIFVLFGGRFGIHVRRKHLIPSWERVLKILRLGVPSSIEQSSRALGIAVMMLLVSSFGTVAIASYGIGARIFSFVIIPAMGLSMATSTVVGQSVGAGQDERAREAARLAMAAGFAALSAAGAVLWLLATPVVRAFVPNEPEVIDIGTDFLHIMSPAFGFFGVQMVMSGALAGAGNTTAAMTLTLLAFWVLRFPVAWVLSMPAGLETEGVFWSFPISNVLSGIIAVWWFLRGSWIRRVVTPEATLAEAVREQARVEEPASEA